jgi:hypothetical protein
MSGKQYGAYARVSICRACGDPFVPPGYDGCCSVRCVQYLEVAREPVLGDPIFCQRDEPIKCWSCEVSFMSRGLRYCPECWDRSKSNEAEAGVGVDLAAGASVTQHAVNGGKCNEPIIDRVPRSLYRWRRLDDSEA